MKKSFGTLPSGEATFLYTISCGKLSAAVTDYGATLVSLLVPDRDGVTADVSSLPVSMAAYRSSRS